MAASMKLLLCVVIALVLISEGVSQKLSLATLVPQTTENGERQSVVLEFKFGFSDDGAVRPKWREAIRYLRNKPEMPVERFGKKRLSEDEALWAELVKRKVLVWPNMIDSLSIPFKSIMPPDTVTVLVGNQHGEDAFVYSDFTICFDLSMLRRIYGKASAPVNTNRLDRFFAHEFTHVLHKAWKRKNGLAIASPFELALWECLTEGLGNYRSLSDKWLAGNGELTGHATEVLGRLQAIFVQRISALMHASDAEAAVLMDGLSMGPFEQKWGALTVALWLSQEAKGDDANLQKWVDAGPAGILQLAQKYLPEELKTELPTMMSE